MITVTTLLRASGGDYYSEPFDRGGPRGTFSIYIDQLAGTSPSLVVTIQHKKFADTTWTNHADGSSTLSTAGAWTDIDRSNLLEQVRYKFSVGGTASTNIATFRMMEPKWNSAA